MSNNKNEKFIQEIRTDLDQIPDRKADSILEGKARFLAQAKLIQRSPVSVEQPERRNNWNIKRLKEVRMGTLVTVLVVIGMLFGGVGGTVAAAQNDLPGDALYQVKLVSEGLQLDLAKDPLKKMDLDLQFAFRRLDEIKALKDAGIEPPYLSYARFENSLQHAIYQASLLDESEAENALLRIREMLRIRVQLMDQTLEEPVQQQTRTLLQERLSWLDEGLNDPVRFLNEARIAWETAPNQGEISGPQNGGVTDENRPGNQGQPEDIPGTGPGSPTEPPGEGSGNGPSYDNGGINGGNGEGQNGNGSGK